MSWINVFILRPEETEIQFKEFYLNNFHRVKNFANVYLNDEYMSENIAQDIFIKIYEIRDRMALDDSLISYLYSATKNKCLNELRRRKTLQSYYADTEYRFRVDLASETLDSQLLSDSDVSLLNDTYQKTLNSLPEITRETFLLHQDCGLRYQDIADLYGVSIKTIEYRISFALKRFRVAFKGLLTLVVFLAIGLLGK